MKIGITCHPSTGGSGVLASELGRLLAQRGHHIHFITSQVPFRLKGAFQENLFFHTLELESYPVFDHAPYDLALAAKMREVAASEKLDLLHVHYAIPHAVCALLAAELHKPHRLPVVTTLHGTDITLVGQNRSFFEITRFAIDRSTRVTAVSDYLRSKTQEVFKTERAIDRIHNFVDLSLFQRHAGACTRATFAEPGQTLFFHISNFRPVKRVLDVVRIFARVRESEDAVLVMVGEGPDLREAKQLAQELRVDRWIRFLGNQLDIASLLSCGDVFLFPSEIESFGLAPLEAMACEMPVIGSDSGGIPEVVAHGETGFLSPVGDVESMAAHAVTLCRDAELRVRMGQAGRRRAEERFRPDHILPQYEKLYQEVAGG
jgi:N-acetyl-alpha-D-glucosaminyl L-malate synthase BshA